MKRLEMPSEVMFENMKTRKVFEKLKHGSTEDKELYSYLERAISDLRDNCFCGIQIPTKRVPKDYLKTHKLKNLWKYNLPNAWRLLYSIR